MFAGYTIPAVILQYEKHGYKACDYRGHKPCNYPRLDNTVYILPAHQFLLNLQNTGEKRWELEGCVFKESKFQRAIVAEEYKLQIHCYWLWKVWLANLFNSPLDVRRELVERCSAMRPNASGLPFMPYSLYHRALAWVDMGRPDEAIVCLQGLSGYAAVAPMNFKGMELHIQAEIETDIRRKMDLYDEAIDHAETSHHLHLSSFMNERCGHFTSHFFPRKRAFGYFPSAIQIYRQWGCIKGDELGVGLGYESILPEPSLRDIPVLPSPETTPIAERLQFTAL